MNYPLVNKRKLGLRLHGLMTKYLPAILTGSVFVGISNYASFLRIVDPLVWFTTLGFLVGGAAFLYEGLVVFPEKGKFAGLATAILMVAMGVINFILGLAIFMHWFNPYFNNTQLVMFASIMIGFSTILLFIAGTAEVILSRRLAHLLGGKKTAP